MCPTSASAGPSRPRPDPEDHRPRLSSDRAAAAKTEGIRLTDHKPCGRPGPRPEETGIGVRERFGLRHAHPADAFAQELRRDVQGSLHAHVLVEVADGNVFGFVNGK